MATEIVGTFKSDSLIGDDNDNSIIGKRGKDFLQGGAGNDYLEGDEGRDVLQGGSGADRLEGGKGNDVLQGGMGDDLMYGGAGRDTYVWTSSDLEAGTFDSVYDDKGSRFQFDSALLSQLELNGNSLDSIKGRMAIGSEINSSNSLAFHDGALFVDLDGNGTFDVTQDVTIDIVGNASHLSFLGGKDMILLG